MRLRAKLVVVLFALVMVSCALGAAIMVEDGAWLSAIVLGGCSIFSGWCVGQYLATERYR